MCVGSITYFRVHWITFFTKNLNHRILVIRKCQVFLKVKPTWKSGNFCDVLVILTTKCNCFTLHLTPCSASYARLYISNNQTRLSALGYISQTTKWDCHCKLLQEPIQAFNLNNDRTCLDGGWRVQFGSVQMPEHCPLHVLSSSKAHVESCL